MGRAQIADFLTSAVIATEARISEREVRLAPKQPLEGGWYVLEVAALPSPLRWPDRPEFPIQNGIGRSRFRVGSEPHVMRIVLCEKAEHRTKLQVVVSEEVVVNEPVRDHLTVESADGPVRCDFSLSGGELTALCDLTCIESVKLTLDEAFATVSQPSSPAAAATAEFEFSPAALPTVETGCKALKAM